MTTMQPTDAEITPTTVTTIMQLTNTSMYYEDGFTVVAIVIIVVQLAMLILLIS